MEVHFEAFGSDTFSIVERDWNSTGELFYKVYFAMILYRLFSDTDKNESRLQYLQD